MRRALLVLVMACSGSGGGQGTTAIPPPPPPPSTVDAGVVAPDAAVAAITPPDIKQVTAATQIKGSAYVEPQGYAQAKGAVKTLTGIPARGRVRWTIVVAGAKGDASVIVELPPQLAPPFVVGTNVQLDLRTSGGGPNAFGNVRVLDEHGVPLLLVDYAPDGWSVDYGKRLKVEKGSTYDEVTYAAKVGPTGKELELGSEWRAGTIDGVRFFGQGFAAKRNLHGRAAPPDYVGSWIDFTMIRAL